MRTIGEAMLRARRRAGYTVRELAEEAGVGQSTIYRAEGNELYPSLMTVVACADVLGISIDEYIGRGQEKE